MTETSGITKNICQPSPTGIADRNAGTDNTRGTSRGTFLSRFGFKKRAVVARPLQRTQTDRAQGIRLKKPTLVSRLASFFKGPKRDDSLSLASITVTPMKFVPAFEKTEYATERNAFFKSIENNMDQYIGYLEDNYGDEIDFRPKEQTTRDLSEEGKLDRLKSYTSHLSKKISKPSETEKSILENSAPDAKRNDLDGLKNKILELKNIHKFADQLVFFRGHSKKNAQASCGSIEDKEQRLEFIKDLAPHEQKKMELAHQKFVSAMQNGERLTYTDADFMYRDPNAE